MFRNSCNWSIFWYLTVPVTLKAGTNSVSFGNPATCTRDIDRVTVAPLNG
ncbi:hypothetical protein [Streptomyces sp. NPDC002132]